MDCRRHSPNSKSVCCLLTLLVAARLVTNACADPPPACPNLAAETTANPAASDEIQNRIQEWIVELSSQEYAARRHAFMELWKQGPVALPAVRRALTTSDQQTISAAKVLEHLLSLDISPNDNDELAELTQLTGNNWEATLRGLSQKGHWRLASELLRNNEELVGRLREFYPPVRLTNFIQTAFEQGDPLQAWPLVAQCLSPERRFYLLEKTRKQLQHSYKNSIPANIEQTLNVVGDPLALSEDDRALYFLYSGQAQAAWDLNPSPRTKQRIIYHTGNWEWLKDPVVTSLTLGPNGDTRLRRAQLAAYMRLAGDLEKSDELIDQLREDLDHTDTKTLKSSTELERSELLRALSMCGEGKLVVDLVNRTNATVSSDYYTYQLQHEKVLQKYQIAADMGNFDDWLEELPGKLNRNGPAGLLTPSSYQTYVELTMFLIHTGSIDEARKLYNVMLESTRRQADQHLVETWDALTTRAEDPQVRKFLLNYLDENESKLKPEERQYILGQIFPDWRYTADKLWQYLPASLSPVAGKSQRWQVLDRLWRYDRSLLPDDAAARAVENWLTTALREASKGEDASDEATGEVAKIATNLGMRRQALAMVRQEATRHIFADMAEMLTANSSFEAAGKWWESAINQAPNNHAWIRRYADVLLLQGEAELAAKYENSLWLRPMPSRPTQGDEVSYSMISDDYFEAGDYELAQQYAEASVAVGDLADPAFGWWSKRMAQVAVEVEDYETAARGSRIFAISLLQNGTIVRAFRGDPLTLIQYYAGQDLLYSAAADIRAGQLETALRSIAKFEELLPSGIEICEHCYPLLVKAGHQAEADALLERCASRMMKHLEAWPKDANSHNNLAWMLARCNARLEEALEHSKQAVQISDRSPTYVDTLAEIEYRLGHTQRAVELTRECIAADPRHAHYQKQLQRFRQPWSAEAKP